MTSLKPCLLIPVYNHPSALPQLVAELSRYELPILLVDDGSDEETRRILDRLAEEQDSVRLFRLPFNQGKGAAVCRGFREAAALGYSHAIQIDADGQHEPLDVPRFLELAADFPDFLILGKPIFGAEAPLSRVLGRKISQFWVWVETLSFEIGDPLFGYRCYPLAPVMELLERIELGARMDFDPEICVQLHWQGVPVMNLETPVIYPDGGRSHFKLFRDNLRISWVHTRLVFGMLPRSVGILKRRFRRLAQREGASTPTDRRQK